MTEIFRGGMTSNLALEFSERIKYRKFLQQVTHQSNYEVLDTLYEKSLYGFINSDYEVIAPTADASLFGDYAPSAKGLTFVVNQFNRFRDNYLARAENGDFQVPALISGLIPRVSYLNYETDYSSYLETLKPRLVTKALAANSPSLVNFEEFVRFFHKAMFDLDVYEKPLSKSGFMLSRESSVHNTGLYIDLGQGQSPSLDQAKVDFIRDEGFVCFLAEANKFGFYLDANYPWRIAVNIGSEYTQTLLLNNRPTPRFYDFYADMFTIKVGPDDYWALRKLFKETFLTFLTELEILSTAPIEAPKELWLETLLLVKFKELSLMQNPDPTNLFNSTKNYILDISDRNRLTSISGPLGAINSFCAEQLKNKILGQP